MRMAADPKFAMRVKGVKVMAVGSGAGEPDEDGDFRDTFVFGRVGRRTFSEWVLGEEIDEEDEEEAEELAMKLYKGKREVLVDVLTRRREGRRCIDDFSPLPPSAAWVLREFPDEAAGRRIVPSLEDETVIYALLPSSAAVAVGSTGILKCPDPDAKLEGTGSTYMCESVWFEDCGDGGMYVLGIEDNVYLFYLDSPGDTVINRFVCSRARWHAIWEAAFGPNPVSLPPI